ncbi:family 78 glycoside hydrolase catalytic domain [Microbacterium sp. NPDC056044]|uniref:family 78 glycoside hydrolase catalytic domain n=1 Tax=Microbacterium sp. NPDC056044 TaxID=3345690 RepID=UPI0035DA958E
MTPNARVNPKSPRPPQLISAAPGGTCVLGGLERIGSQWPQTPASPAGRNGGSPQIAAHRVHGHLSLSPKRWTTARRHISAIYRRGLTQRELTGTPDGTKKNPVDFDQNLSGVVRIRTRAKHGSRVLLQHAEDVDGEGRVEWQHLDREGRKRRDRPRRFQQDEIVSDGRGGWVQPWFTLHGFRYVHISGLAIGELIDIEAVVLSSVEADPAAFRSSDPRLDALYRNATWSMTGNFLDTPTDCPTRERGGFTGDAQVFAPTATALADVTGFFTRYLRSLRIDQFDDGRVPMIIPKEFSPFSGPPKGMTAKAAGSVGWGDAAVLLPWELYEATGNGAILDEQFDSMIAWVDYLRRGGARKGFIWGEWIRAGESSIAGAVRDNSVNRKNIGLAYLAHSAAVLARSAEVLGRVGEAEQYTRVAQDAVSLWRRVAVRRGGSRIGSDRQDDYVRALSFDLLAPGERARAADRLAQLIEHSGHIGTGFLSTSLILPVLTAIGRRDLAYQLLLNESPPGWLAQVGKGATTIWENWEEPDRKGRRVGSSNHYAFGSVASWLISSVVGLTSSSPGRRELQFRPILGGGLTQATGSLMTDFGAVTASWRLDGNRLVASLKIPVGVCVVVPIADEVRRLQHGAHEIQLPLQPASPLIAGQAPELAVAEL